MARVQVIADDGWVALDELALPVQMQSEQYRRCLADRIQWAVDDAERRFAGRDAQDLRPTLSVVPAPAPQAA